MKKNKHIFRNREYMELKIKKPNDGEIELLIAERVPEILYKLQQKEKDFKR